MEWYNDQGYVGSVESVDSDGMIPVPDGPGFGVEIDWSFVEEHQTGHIVIDGSATADSFP
jgi:L-alanine-DL-glutamate epimerase-like enolase superfamily enzyme